MILKKVELSQLLNKSQQEAVEYCDGSELVIAGAGSGKTRVLTYKIAFLIELGVEPYSIMALTFTNKAAREMRSRIAAVVGEQKSRQLWMGTFHSIFLRILRAHAQQIGYRSDFSIYDTDDSVSLIRRIIKDLDLTKDKNYKPSAIFSRISSMKNKGILCDDYVDAPELVDFDKAHRIRRFGEIYKLYTQQCATNHAMDFDDILIKMLELLKIKGIREHYQAKFNYILVDEYQDTNSVQHKIVTILANKHEHLCVVGDDAQSIYSFRGACISNILDFKKDFPDAKLFKLEQNYRSTQMIVNAANSLIAKNSVQIKKQVYSHRSVGDPIDVRSASDDRDEASMVAMDVATLVRRKMADYQDVAVLYRNNSQSRVIEEAFRKYSIPYVVVAGISFYQRAEIKDILAYMRFIVNPFDLEALTRIINFPARGIGGTTQKILFDAMMTHTAVSPLDILQEPKRYGVELKPAAERAVGQFVQMITDLTQKSKEAAVDIFTDSLIEQTKIEEEYSPIDEQQKSKLDNIKEFKSATYQFAKEHFEDGDFLLSDFLSEVALITDQDVKSQSIKDSVSLMTVHSAKGLEFDYVFVVGLEDGIFPGQKSFSNFTLEEERRLLYVAITRAKERCFLSYARERFLNGQYTMFPPSQFIKDIDEDYLRLPHDFARKKSQPQQYSFSERYAPIPTQEEHVSAERSDEYGLSVGDRVEHMVFGQGFVEQILDSGPNCKAVIIFDRAGRKMLLLKFARLKKIS